MLDAALAAGERTRPDIPVRLERFAAAADGPPTRARTQGFEVELARSGVTVTVPAGVSVLDAVRAAIPGVMSSCEQGICSACETAVLAGLPDHRDSVLTAKEHAANNYMMICVSRALTPGSSSTCDPPRLGGNGNASRKRARVKALLNLTTNVASRQHAA